MELLEKTQELLERYINYCRLWLKSGSFHTDSSKTSRTVACEISWTRLKTDSIGIKKEILQVNTEIKPHKKYYSRWKVKRICYFKKCLNDEGVIFFFFFKYIYAMNINTSTQSQNVFMFHWCSGRIQWEINDGWGLKHTQININVIKFSSEGQILKIHNFIKKVSGLQLIRNQWHESGGCRCVGMERAVMEALVQKQLRVKVSKAGVGVLVTSLIDQLLLLWWTCWTITWFFSEILSKTNWKEEKTTTSLEILAWKVVRGPPSM